MREGLDRIAGFQDFQDEERGIALYPIFPIYLPKPIPIYLPNTNPFHSVNLSSSASPCEEEMAELLSC